MITSIPNYPVVFASCDAEYFLQHAPAFCSSCSENGFDVHLHIINANDRVFYLLYDISKKCKTRVTFTRSVIDTSKFTEEQERAYYACSRFLVLPEILKVAKKVLTLDIDCLVMKPFTFPQQNSGYFPRDYEHQPELKVAAGALYLTESAIGICHRIIEELNYLELRWFADQIAISRAFADDVSSFRFDNKFMDWEFSDNSCIWTGKGDRKYNNEKYLEKKNYYNALLSLKNSI